MNRLFLFVMYSLYDGDLSGNGYGLVTSLRYGCLLKASCSLCSVTLFLSSVVALELCISGAAPVNPTFTLFKF